MKQTIPGNFTVRVDTKKDFGEVNFNDAIEAMNFFNQLKFAEPVVRITLSRNGNCIRSYPENKVR